MRISEISIRNPGLLRKPILLASAIQVTGLLLYIGCRKLKVIPFCWDERSEYD